ncbi:glycosyl transferase family 1 [Clostridia bacterium]|nr:glycosyl transferase family 1 [Clostridia bacterium]
MKPIKPLRILHVIGKMDLAGAEIMIMNLYRAIDREIVQFDFVEHSNKLAAFDEEIEALGGIIYRAIRFNGRNIIEYCSWWNRFFENHKEEYHIIHGHIGSCAAIYLTIAKKNGCICIAHSHNTDHLVEFRNYLYKVYSYPTRFIADYFFACSKAALVSRYGYKHCLEKSINSVDEITINSKSIILPNAISTSLFAYNINAREQIRWELGLSDKIVLGNVARFSKQKNHMFLIDIFYNIHKIYENAMLMLIGVGELKEEIENRVRHLGISNSVLFLGNRIDISDLMQAMDFFVFPSLYEGLGVAIIEAAASGLCCLISSTIPNEAHVTKKVIPIPINKGTEPWVTAFTANLTYHRQDCSDIVKAAGYDNKDISKKLQEFYLNVLPNN